MKYSIIVLGVLAVAMAGCDTQIDAGNSGGAPSSSSSGGAGGTGGSGGAMGGAGGMGGEAGSVSSSSGSGGGCGFCDFTCCDATCVNTNNDINNCGACGNKCSGTSPYCDNGKCSVPPCNGPLCGPAGTCCGSNCCMPGQLCCLVPGPIGENLGCFDPNAAGTCPTGCATCQCTAPDTPIATPNGDRPIQSLKEGDLVYSVHRGAVVVVPVRKTQRMAVTNHFMVRVELSTGAVLEISPGHPTADGKSFADLEAGGKLFDMPIRSVRRVAYEHEFTYDILPDSDSGTYFAAGALIGSTMDKSSRVEMTKPNHL